MTTIRPAILLLALAMFFSCHSAKDKSPNAFTPEEIDLVCDPRIVMRVLTVDSEADSLVLREKCRDLSPKALQSADYARLAVKMIATVTSPEQDGVGIAGPQVGLSRRVVAVQRFDKEGEPFEVYPNIRITAVRGEKELGPEGCLSIPGRSGEVARYQDIDITYSKVIFRKSRLTGEPVPSGVKDTTETVKGYTAVIFQHECDHLDGVLYTDYLED